MPPLPKKQRVVQPRETRYFKKALALMALGKDKELSALGERAKAEGIDWNWIEQQSWALRIMKEYRIPTSFMAQMIPAGAMMLFRKSMEVTNQKTGLPDYHTALGALTLLSKHPDMRYGLNDLVTVPNPNPNDLTHFLETLGMEKEMGEMAKTIDVQVEELIDGIQAEVPLLPPGAVQETEQEQEPQGEDDKDESSD